MPGGFPPNKGLKGKNMKNIKLSKKHGLNAVISVCYFCNEPKNEIIIAGRLPNDDEAPKYAIWNMEPCDKCKGYMEQGIILISVKNGERGNNPYRTGGWVVINEDAAKQIFGDNCQAIKSRIAFVDDEAWDKIGLPRE